MQDNRNNTDIISSPGGIITFDGRNPAYIQDFLKKFSLVVSTKRPDKFDIMEGRERPVATAEADTAPETPFY